MSMRKHLISDEKRNKELLRNVTPAAFNNLVFKHELVAILLHFTSEGTITSGFYVLQNSVLARVRAG